MDKGKHDDSKLLKTSIFTSLKRLETLTGNTTMNVASVSLLSNLPEGCVTRTWKNFHILQQAASDVYNALQENEHAGNQYIVVISLSKHAIQRLSEDKNALGGIRFRFAFEGAVGLVKIIPSAAHDRSTDDLTRMVDRVFSWGHVRSHELQLGFHQQTPGNGFQLTKRTRSMPVPYRKPSLHGLV